MLDTALCPCGSGLRGVRCCRMDLDALTDPANLFHLDEAALAATRLYNEKKPREAAAAALKLLDLAPNHRAALRVLFEVRKAENRASTAEILGKRLAMLPGATPAIESAANLQLAQMLIGQSRHIDAEPAARKAVIATPRDATAHHVMAVVLTETGRAPAGEWHYRKALVLLGREDGTVQANLAWNLKLQGRLNEAAGLYDRALTLRPDNPRAVGGYAQVEMARGESPHAVALLDGAVLRWPDDRSLRLLRVMADLALGRAEAALARLDQTQALLPAELATCGQALALLDQKVAAVRLFAQAKSSQRDQYGISYQPAALLEKAARYKAYFTAERMLAMTRAPRKPGPLPVFLLGFARSGTSLLEQILLQIPGFTAASELLGIESLVTLTPELAARPGETALPYPQLLDATLIGDRQELAARLRDRYEAGSAAAVTGETRFITDRGSETPWNLGLIKLLYPEAPVIHLLRHPLDIMLSNLSQERRLDANANVSMATLAKHYDLVMSLIRHFRGQLALRYLPVRYEALVTETAATAAEILRFIGAGQTMPPEAGLRANRAALPPLVPAHMGGRQPVHARGLYRHRDYEAVMPNLFSEVRPVLASWIAELGYGEVP